MFLIKKEFGWGGRGGGALGAVARGRGGGGRGGVEGGVKVEGKGKGESLSSTINYLNKNASTIKYLWGGGEGGVGGGQGEGRRGGGEGGREGGRGKGESLTSTINYLNKNASDNQELVGLFCLHFHFIDKEQANTAASRGTQIT